MTPQTDSGNVLEQTVKGSFLGKKFEIVNFRKWKGNPGKYGEELLLTNVPYETIYGHKGNTEFLLKSKRYRKEIRIECKLQQGPGSVDEKLPYLYLNMVEKIPENEIIVVIDGDGWKAGSIPWLKNAVKNKMYSNESLQNKMLRVFNLREFVTWVNQEF